MTSLWGQAPPIPQKILAFTADEDGDWIAQLGCGHRRHIRHRPPLCAYPWIVDPAARAQRLGTQLECERCARLELPEDAHPYRSTEIFDETTLPAGLRREHRTAAGVWGRVELLEGRLRFVMPALGLDLVLEAGSAQLIPPGLPHHVEPIGPIRMQVVFLRSQRAHPS